MITPLCDPVIVYTKDMTLDDMVSEACKKSTLVDALTLVAIWESERAIEQAKNYFLTGISTADNGGGWDTCFKVCFEAVMKAYPTENSNHEDNSIRS